MMNNLVTKTFLKKELKIELGKLRREMRAENKKNFESVYQMILDLRDHIDTIIIEQRKEYERYMGALSEEFQRRLGLVAELVTQNTKDIRNIKEHLRLES